MSYWRGREEEEVWVAGCCSYFNSLTHAWKTNNTVELAEMITIFFKYIIIFNNYNFPGSLPALYKYFFLIYSVTSMIYLLLFPCITETWGLECKVMYLLVTKLANDRASIYPGSLTPLFVLFNTVQYYLLDNLLKAVMSQKQTHCVTCN